MTRTTDPKKMARTLRSHLARRNVALTHGEALELVARQLGYESWNVLCAADETLAPASPDGSLPEGWMRHGRSDLFLSALKSGAAPDGGPAICIESRMQPGAERVPQPGEFVTVMQSIAADAFRERRVTFSALLRTEGATGTARLWMRVDGPSRERLTFANLENGGRTNGPLSGDADWARRRATLDIPQEAAAIKFGFLFGSGCGRALASGFRFGDAAPDEHPEHFPAAPRNLDLVAGREA